MSMSGPPLLIALPAVSGPPSACSGDGALSHRDHRPDRRTHRATISSAGLQRSPSHCGEPGPCCGWQRSGPCPTRQIGGGPCQVVRRTPPHICQSDVVGPLSGESGLAELACRRRAERVKGAETAHEPRAKKKGRAPSCGNDLRTRRASRHPTPCRPAIQSPSTDVSAAKRRGVRWTRPRSRT